MTPSEIQRRLALKIRLNKIEGVGITGPVILHEVLYMNSYPSKLVQGYCRINEGEPCWHLIVMVDTEPLDIGYTLACLQDPEYAKYRVTLSQEEPEKYESDKMVTDSWELYQKDPKEFWKKMPMKLQNFRAKMMREFK